jgi:hypothetical protein
VSWLTDALIEARINAVLKQMAKFEKKHPQATEEERDAYLAKWCEDNPCSAIEPISESVLTGHQMDVGAM